MSTKTFWGLGQAPRTQPMYVAGQMVPRAAALAEFPSEIELNNPHVLTAMRETSARLKDEAGKRFGVEIDLKRDLLKKHQLLEHRIRKTENGLLGLPSIDPSFLAWKTANGYPAFSVYNLHNPSCVISYKHGGGKRNGFLDMVPYLPSIVTEHFLDAELQATLEQEARVMRLTQITLTAHYTGGMPQDLNEKVRGYVEGIGGENPFSQIIIVAEAPKWKRNTVSAIAPGDPLVIGIRHDTMALIGAYDLTPVEQIAMELCTGSTERARN